MLGRIGAKRSWNGQYTVPCDKVPSLPELTFYFGGKPYPLQGSDYVLNAGGTCISAFTGMDINLPGGELWIVGTYLSLLSSSHIFTPSR
jgi:saccharopepsin